MGEVGCPETSQHVTEDVGDLTLVAFLVLLRRHSGKVEEAMELNCASHKSGMYHEGLANRK
jgi:hypothetical protein